jgi:surface protein
MFCGCSSLTNLNLSNFKTQNVTIMGYMFYGCSSLINLNLSNFKTQNVTSMGYMFNKCPSLKINNLITNNNKILEEFKK